MSDATKAVVEATDAEIKALCTAWTEISPFRMGASRCDWPTCKCAIAPKLTKHVLAALTAAKSEWQPLPAAPHVPEGWRAVKFSDLANILGRLPPLPIEKDGVKFFYADPNAVTTLHQIRSAFDNMLASSPPAPAAGREAVLEEAAKVAENFRSPNPFPTIYAAIAAAIRALASKPAPEPPK